MSDFKGFEGPWCLAAPGMGQHTELFYITMMIQTKIPKISRVSYDIIILSRALVLYSESLVTGSSENCH